MCVCVCVRKCVLYYCHRVATQLRLTNISYHIQHVPVECDFQIAVSMNFVECKKQKLLIIYSKMSYHIIKTCNRNLRWQRNKSKAVSLGRIAVSPSSRSHSIMLANLMLTTHCQEEGNVLCSAIKNTIGGIHDTFSSFSVVIFFVDCHTTPFRPSPSRSSTKSQSFQF